jgi:phospholipid/cholesterol/gamma-HCH transport system permease protein
LRPRIPGGSIRYRPGADLVSGKPLLETISRGERLELAATGSWTAEHAGILEPLVDSAGGEPASVRVVDIDMRGVHRLDTFGAWLLERLIRIWTERGCQTRVLGLPEDYRGLIDKVQEVSRKPPPPRERTNRIVDTVANIGQIMTSVGHDLVGMVQMLGAVVSALGRVVLHPGTFRFTSMVHHLDRVGWHAVPIVLLITFLIGAILSQQGIFHFRRFGADIFVIDMVGILVLREIGVLIVCIMVAGRSGSAYTAELGSMKMREEIDALRTMGFDPIEVLVLPRIIALLVAVPLLTFLGSMAALYGGGLVAWLYGGIQPDVFLSRLKEALSLDHFLVGIIKAPFMALVIGTIACVEGFAVKGSAESMGAQTTASVVKSIFAVIVLDGLFAMFFASIGK